MDYKEMYEGLSDDLKKKVTECKTAEELMKLSKSEGIELSDEQLDAISGGSIWSDAKEGADGSGWF